MVNVSVHAAFDPFDPLAPCRSGFAAVRQWILNGGRHHPKTFDAVFDESLTLAAQFRAGLGAEAWASLPDKFRRTIEVQGKDPEVIAMANAIVAQMGRAQEGRATLRALSLPKLDATAMMRTDGDILTVTMGAVNREGQSYYSGQYAQSLGGGKVTGGLFVGMVKAGMREMARLPHLKAMKIQTGNTINALQAVLFKKMGFTPKFMQEVPATLQVQLESATTVKDFEALLATIRNFRRAPNGPLVFLPKESFTWSLVIPRG